MIALIIWLAIGALAGYLGSKIMGAGDQGLGKNILLGIVGGVVGGLLGKLIGLGATNLIGSILLSVVGACIVIWAYRKFVK